MIDITMEDVRNVEEKLSPCPFCGIKPRIIICDDEGNIKRNPEEYIKEQWSGLSFALIHPVGKEQNCPIATDEDDDIVLGNCLYGSLDELVEMWNRRFIPVKPEKSWLDDISAIYLRLNENDTYTSYIPMTPIFDSSRLSYLKNLSFDEAVKTLREKEWKGGSDIRFVFKNGDVKDYKI